MLAAKHEGKIKSHGQENAKLRREIQTHEKAIAKANKAMETKAPLIPPSSSSPSCRAVPLRVSFRFPTNLRLGINFSP